MRSSEAQLRSQEAGVTQSQASLRQNQVNLAHTVIESPIDGLVISRNVDVGQTVAASMSAPTLFVLAADLTKMQVLASLDESDVGRIRPGQAVRFRVDAFPTEEFTGSVTQVRLQPTTVQNVVTYQTVIDVPNPGLKLKPGMTANVNIEIARRDKRPARAEYGAAVPADGRNLRCAGTDTASGRSGRRRRPRTWRRRRPRHAQCPTGDGARGAAAGSAAATGRSAAARGAAASGSADRAAAAKHLERLRKAKARRRRWGAARVAAAVVAADVETWQSAWPA